MKTQNQFGYTEDESGIWELSECAADGTTAERPYVFINLSTPVEKLAGVLERYVEAGAGGVIPYLPASAEADIEDSDGHEAIAARRRFYKALLPLAENAGLGVAFTLDKYLERTWIDVEDALYENETYLEWLRVTGDCQQPLAGEEFWKPMKEIFVV